MKKLIFAILATVAVTSASAQFAWDARIGANASQFSEGGNMMKLGLKVGAGVEYGISDLFALRSGLYFSMKGASKDKDFAIGKEESINISYLDLPLMASFRFPVTSGFKLALNGGVYGALRLNDPDLVADPATADFGVAAGLDFIFSQRFVMGAEVQYGLADVAKNSSMKNINYSLVFGYRF